uniref:Atos homolog protein B n=1 Tax=Myripristis murdjan TaxID=586833 RepID=A0A667WY97_9TELE
MRHIHVELARKEAPLELPAQEGDLPPPTAPTQGLDPGVRPGAPRPFGQEELRLQKVYQLSIFSQLGGFSTSTDPHTEAQPRPVRMGVKRGLEEPQLTHKRPHLGDSSDKEVLEGGVLCGPGPAPGVGVGSGPGPGGPGPSPSPASPTSPPGPFSPPHHSELQEPGEATEWGAGLESSPPERSATQVASSSNGLASWEKTPSSNGHRSSFGGHCPAKKKLLSPSDTGESCSEDEGPSTSKRSRLALLAPGLGLASCRSTDAKAAPYWNHLLPSARDRPKVSIQSHIRQLRSGRHTDTSRSTRSSWPSSSISRSLLGNFEESILKGRFSPSGRIEGFTAEIGASGSYCPQHATLPVQVTYYDISEHSAPSPFLGVISLEPLGKKGYSIPKAGTIQVTLFNPNKTVVKMFLVTYNFGDMPVNHMTFLRHRIFLVPVEEGVEGKGEGPPGGGVIDRKKILCYLIHLRFQSSKSGKIYLHNDIRLLFSRKSIEVDTGIPYELKSFTEVPRNPKYSPRV